MKALALSFRLNSKPFQSSFFSSSPPLRTRDHASFRTRTQVGLRGACSSKRLECRDGGEMVANSSPDGEDVKKKKTKKLAVFVSGRRSNFRAIHEACVAGTISGQVAVVVTEKSGGMRLTSFSLLGIINTHPSLLPVFRGKGYYGMKVHDSVIASGARYSGPTIHFIDEHYNRGCILAQRVILVLASDTAKELATRVLRVEHRLYVEAVAALCKDRIVWREDGVPLIRSIENPERYS